MTICSKNIESLEEELTLCILNRSVKQGSSLQVMLY